MKIHNLNHVYEGLQAISERVDNDIYGNPRYLVAIMYRNNHLYIEMKGYRKRKDYKYQLHSYNIDEDVQKLAEDFVRNHTAFN